MLHCMAGRKKVTCSDLRWHTNYMAIWIRIKYLRDSLAELSHPRDLIVTGTLQSHFQIQKLYGEGLHHRGCAKQTTAWGYSPNYKLVAAECSDLYTIDRASQTSQNSVSKLFRSIVSMLGFLFRIFSGSEQVSDARLRNNILL